MGACIGPTAPGNTLLPAELPFTVADGSISDRKKACPLPWASLERIRPKAAFAAEVPDVSRNRPVGFGFAAEWGPVLWHWAACAAR